MYLIFDIGGSNIRIGISVDGQNITDSKIIPLNPDFEQGLEIFRQTAEELNRGEKIQAAIGGITGLLDKEKTMLAASPNIPGWVNRPLKDRLQQAFNCPVILENDSALVSLGEATKGPGVNHKIVACLTLGTGVGGARIINGKLDESSSGFEPGHQIIVIDGDGCNCGGRGHLEAYIGGFYIQRRYNQKSEDIKDSAVWDEVSKYLAIGLNNTAVYWSPDIIILAGSVTQSVPLENVNRYFRQFCTIFPSPPEIIKGTLGDNAGLYGALALVQLFS